MLTAYQDELKSRASFMARRLTEVGLTATVVDASLRDYHLKIHVACGTQDLGHLMITTGRNGSTYRTHEMKRLDLDPVIKRCWDNGRIEEARRVLALMLAAPDPTAAVDMHACVDGSYNAGCAGYGAVIEKGGEVVEELSGVVTDPESRHIDGEIEAVLQVLAWCAAHGTRQIVIHHDYVGLSRWADGSWRTYKDLTKAYARRVQQSGIEIIWAKVDAHSGHPGNERADQLARKAIIDYLAQWECCICGRREGA